MPVVYVDYPGPASLTQIYGTFNRAMLRLIPSLRTYAEPLTAAMVEFYTMSQVRASPPPGHGRALLEDSFIPSPPLAKSLSPESAFPTQVVTAEVSVLLALHFPCEAGAVNSADGACLTVRSVWRGTCCHCSRLDSHPHLQGLGLCPRWHLNVY